jgi:glycosyltransferase involved in cell wall biosynthesis
VSGRVFARVWKTVRAADWWAYKIPPLLAIAYAGFIRFEAPPAGWRSAGPAILAIVLVAVFGYCLNDLCDVESDRRSGRRNRMANLRPMARLAVLVTPLIFIALLAASTGDRILMALLAVNVVLPVLYSVPPVRLKGRAIWGVLADAAAVHAVPAAIVARAVTRDQPASMLVITFVVMTVGWALWWGLRGIVAHQIADRRQDELAGVKTLVTAWGDGSAKRLVLRVLLPLETVFLGGLVALVLPRAPLLGVAIAVFIALEATRLARGWTMTYFEPGTQSRERYLPLVNNELHEFWLPLGLAAQLAIEHPAGVWLMLAHLVVFSPKVRERVGDLRRTLAREPEGSPVRHLQRPLTLRKPPAFQVVIGATTWTVNGVNVFSVNLTRGLAQAGVPAHVIVTEEATDLIDTRERGMPRPPDVPFLSLPVHRTDGWGAHWGALVRYLEEAAPCVYIPNSDWRHSCVVPRLSGRVAVVGVVHSDDPLHYDHVRRLGRYWNVIVAVSRLIAERTAALCPEIADRIVTIPIGVRIPASPPARRLPGDRLRVIYHGVLKQHQKRVLDLPRIVDAAAARGVPIELSIVGAGPDEDELRAAAAPLVDRGLIRFLGVVSPDDTPALLESQDVYLLPSEFEGMPNALIEAMGRGCVPVASRMSSGVPELIDDGRSGFLAPIGDVAGFADRLELLWTDAARRQRMSASAFTAVRRGPFRVEEMIQAYRRVFADAWRDVRAGRFVRPIERLSPPPPAVGGVSLFPVALPHEESGVGAFPSAADARDYQAQIRAIVPGSEPARAQRQDRIHRARASVVLDGVRVWFAAPVWTSHGVNFWSEDMARGLRQHGIDARLLMTEEATALVRIDSPRMNPPSDVPIDHLAVRGVDNWGARWGAMVRLLEANAPCVYVPNYDWRHSCVVPVLSERVAVVGALHDDDPQYFEHAARLGRYWNRIVATSHRVAGRFRAEIPDLADRLIAIPHGFCIPVDWRSPPPADRLAVAVLDVGDDDHARAVANLLSSLAQRRPVQVTLVDPGPASMAALRGTPAEILMRPNRREWLDVCESSHLIVVRTPVAPSNRLVVEAMGHGCIPIVIGDTGSAGIVQDGRDALIGGGSNLVGRLRDSIAHVAEDSRGRERLAGAARATAVANAGYRADQMIHASIELLRDALAEVAVGASLRFRGRIAPPPAEVAGTSIFPVALRHSTADGRFPTRADARRFIEEARTAAAPGGRRAG